MQRIIIVEDVFEIQGRGIVAVGEWENPMQALKEGLAVTIVKPNGTDCHATLGGINVMPKRFGGKSAIGLLVRDIASTPDLPLGSEIYLR